MFLYDTVAELTEQGLTSHQTHYNHIGDDFYRSYGQTSSVEALKEEFGKETSW